MRSTLRRRVLRPRDAIAIYVDGKVNDGDPREIELSEATRIGDGIARSVEFEHRAGQQIVEDATHVLYSWSVQDAIDPIPVAGAEGRYFWDYDGKRYLDFASQLVNVSIGHQHPKVVAAIKEQADRLCTIGPPMANESRSSWRGCSPRSRPAT